MQVPPIDSAAHDDILRRTGLPPLRHDRFGALPGRRGHSRRAGPSGCLSGWVSRFIHRVAPKRPYYLFDTFAGFPQGDLDAGVGEDLRFRDTSLEVVLRNIGDTTNIEPRPGRVPETFVGLEGERFALVLLDMDLHRPTLSALAFFYPRLSPGAYLMVHDYHNPESNWGCKRAVDEFMADKPEGMVELADMWGSGVFRRARPAPREEQA